MEAKLTRRKIPDRAPTFTDMVRALRVGQQLVTDSSYSSVRELVRRVKLDDRDSVSEGKQFNVRDYEGQRYVKRVA